MQRVQSDFARTSNLLDDCLSWHFRKNEYEWEIDPLGEGNYVETLGIECDCGFRIEIVIDENDIRQEHYRELIEKFTGLR